MFATARDVNHGVLYGSGDRGADDSAGHAGVVDVGVIQHGMTAAQNLPRGVGFSFGENVDDTLWIALTIHIGDRPLHSGHVYSMCHYAMTNHVITMGIRRVA